MVLIVLCFLGRQIVLTEVEKEDEEGDEDGEVAFYYGFTPYLEDSCESVLGSFLPFLTAI